MAGDAVKVAVSIPSELYEQVEAERAKTAKSRSAVVQAALRDWLKNRTYAELVREYQEGYRAKPESADEMEDAMRVALDAFADDEDW